MKIAIFSDTHLGFDEKGERETESFENALKAFEIAFNEKADLILLAGDLFDADVPSQETLLKAFKVFSNAKRLGRKAFLKKNVKGKIEEFESTFVPIISIHGTHEFRGKDCANVLELLDLAGLMLYLHVGFFEVGIGGEKVFVHGLGGVPEKKSLDALKLYNPQPLSGGRNILLLHQSIKEYLPFDDEMTATISLADLPQGFDLIVNGHLHWNALEKIDSKKFLLAGSTIITQMKKLESEKPKIVTFYDTKTELMHSIELPNQRKLFYEKIKLENATVEEVKNSVENAIQNALAGAEKSLTALKPMIRVKVVGSLARGISTSEISLSQIEKKFSEKAILSIDKEFSTIAFREKMEELRKLQHSKKSISSLGLEILQKNLLETQFDKAFDVEKVFELLSESKIDEALNEISAKKAAKPA